MHKLIATLLLAVSAAAVISQPATRADAASTSPTLAVSASLAGHAFHREDRAAAGAHFELALTDDVRLMYRLAEFDERTARIEAVVARRGLTLSEPELHVRRGEVAKFALDSPPLAVEFRVDANPPHE